MHEFDFVEPATMSEASRLAADLGDEARLIAGGTALMLALRQRLLTPSHLISLAKLEPLRGISIDAQRALHIGALTLHSEIAASETVRRHSPMLAAMAAQVANPQVRNQGTLGGNLCYADPSTDPPGCLLALDARVRLYSHRGSRELPIAEFLVDYFTTAIEQDELVQEIIVPAAANDTLGQYSRFMRTAAEHRPIVSVAALVRMEHGVCINSRIVVGAAVPVASRVSAAENCLTGHRPTLDLIEQAAAAAAAAISPIDDLRGSATYRRAMTQVQVRRSLIPLFKLIGE